MAKTKKNVADMFSNLADSFEQQSEPKKVTEPPQPAPAPATNARSGTTGSAKT